MKIVVIDSERNRKLNPELIGYIIKPGVEWKANMDVRKLTYEEESFWEMHQDKDVCGPAISGAINELLDELIERVNNDVHNDMRELAWTYIKELLTKEVADRDLPKLDFEPKVDTILESCDNIDELVIGKKYKVSSNDKIYVCRLLEITKPEKDDEAFGMMLFQVDEGICKGLLIMLKQVDWYTEDWVFEHKG